MAFHDCYLFMTIILYSPCGNLKICPRHTVHFQVFIPFFSLDRFLRSVLNHENSKVIQFPVFYTLYLEFLRQVFNFITRNIMFMFHM